MKFGDFILFVSFLIVIGGAGYFVYQLYFSGFLGEGSFDAELEFNVSGNVQFYNNLRYTDRKITYSLEDACNQGKRDNVRDSFSRIEERTILRFNEVENKGEIEILCSGLPPEPEGERGHFVAGEGGPDRIIQAGKYNVIINGKVSLFRIDRCDRPQIATHEILHVLGFDHNTNESSIMYPVTNCDQIIDEYIVDEINSLYRADSLPDLIIDRVDVDGSGRYIDFEISILNAGLKDAMSSKIGVFVDSELVKEFDIKPVEIGNKRILTVENLRMPFGSYEKITFISRLEESELNKENNEVTISVS